VGGGGGGGGGGGWGGVGVGGKGGEKRQKHASTILQREQELYEGKIYPALFLLVLSSCAA